METPIKEFTFFWLDGKREVLKGGGPADALTKGGYSQGALKALDFYDYGNNNNWEWKKEIRTWHKKK